MNPQVCAGGAEYAESWYCSLFNGASDCVVYDLAFQERWRACEVLLPLICESKCLRLGKLMVASKTAVVADGTRKLMVSCGKVVEWGDVV